MPPAGNCSHCRGRQSAAATARKLPSIRATSPLRPSHERGVALSRLLPLWPHELEDESPPHRRRLVARLRRALRAERMRGVSGHWTYDLARHVELLRLYRQELAALAYLERDFQPSRRNPEDRKAPGSCLPHRPCVRS